MLTYNPPCFAKQNVCYACIACVLAWSNAQQAVQDLASIFSFSIDAKKLMLSATIISNNRRSHQLSFSSSGFPRENFIPCHSIFILPPVLGCVNCHICCTVTDCIKRCYCSLSSKKYYNYPTSNTTIRSLVSFPGNKSPQSISSEKMSSSTVIK